MILLIFNFSFSQNNNYLENQEKIENEINNYISKNLKNYKLKNEMILNFEKNSTHNIESHNKSLSISEKKKAIEELKRFELRKKYFQENPKAREIFENLNIKSLLQTCADGDFETWPAANPFVFKIAMNPVNGIGQNIVTTGTDFVPFGVGTSINNFNNLATLVSPGNDPLVPAVSRVQSGNRAIKLNFNDTNFQYNVVTMSRNIIVNENFFDFNYSILLNDPGASHEINIKPFF